MAQMTISCLLFLLCSTEIGAQRQFWRIGGDVAWAAFDSSQVFIDFDSTPGSIQPIYLDPDRSIFSLLDGWEPLKDPRELSYIEGETPRSWKGARGNETTAHNGTYMVDGDSLSFNPPVSSNPESVWYTIDMAVPVPAHRFGFFTPPQGFRSDGTPFVLDAVPAYEVSIAAEGDPSWLEGNKPYQPIGQLIADVAENFATRIQIEFPRQYVRFVRYKRNKSLLDGDNTSQGSGQAFRGSIGDFELFGEGIPRRVVYRSKIIDLGRSVNFGRLSWSATPMRLVDGVAVVAPDADVGIEVEIRTGRDGDPNIYHEYTDRGGEEEVTRERYDQVLQPRLRAGIVRAPRPGMRASIAYDSPNWSFWSLPFTESGRFIDLRGGDHFQLRIQLKSEEFDAYVRLDSLWVETAPLLASRIVGEVARLDDPQGGRGVAHVQVGERVELAYDIRGQFDGGEAGFDALRVRTGTRPAFTRLELDGQVVEPADLDESAEELTVVLPQRIGPGRETALRVVFNVDFFALAWTFYGEVFDTAVDGLPQPVEAGDASDASGTGSLRVLGTSGQDLIQDLVFSSGVLTPNGDGVNDRVEMDFTLVGLPEAVPVFLQIYGLDGRRLARRPLGVRRFGTHRFVWDGRDDQGRLVAPGLYVIEVALAAQQEQGRLLRPLSVAY